MLTTMSKKGKRAGKVEPPNTADGTPDEFLLQVKISPALRSQLELLAKLHESSMSAEVRSALHERLSRFNLWPPPSQ